MWPEPAKKNNKMTHAKNQNNRKREAKITNESDATIKKTQCDKSSSSKPEAKLKESNAHEK